MNQNQIHPKMSKSDDPKLTALADLLGVDRATAIGLRGMLLELAVDFLKSPDLTHVPTQQWALVFRIPPDAVADLIECFVEAGLLEQTGEALLLADWERHSSDESGAAFRVWFRAHVDGFNTLVDRLSRDTKD